VTRLEARIGSSLFHRTSRQIALTEAGRAALAAANRILNAGELAEADALEQSRAPRGLVRLACPMSFGLAHVAPILPDFMAEHPGVSVDLHLSDAIVDLVGTGFDLGIRISALPDSTLRVRRICGIRRHLVGAPEYLRRRGRPMHPDELAGHECLGYAYLPKPDRWHFTGPGGEEVSVTPPCRMRANNADALTPALLNGLGLAVQPDFLIWRELASGQLERLMVEWSPPPIALNLIMPPGGLRPARVNTLIAFLERAFSSVPWGEADEG
jgi:DNA-binding transcriptional LysR family regulator